MNVVIDTNILVSGLLSPHGAPALIVDRLLNKRITPCYDSRIIAEYADVLRRPKFNFPAETVDAVLNFILSEGLSVVPDRTELSFADPGDQCFYEVALFCDAILLTGNTRHFPVSPYVMTAGDFLQKQNEEA